jgi:hypothetical protein
MEEPAFWELHRVLLPYLGGRATGRTRLAKKGGRKHCQVGAKNGIIPSTTQLSIAICYYFTGERPDDIALVHGISFTEVFQSVWIVVNTINRCNKLKISFTTDYNEQCWIAHGFWTKSRARFSCCVGAIDGVLVWIEKPYEAEAEEAGCGGKKFLCGRKKKFGLNMQGTCDHEGRFIDVSICHPALTSDFLAFSTLDLKHKLEKRGFLAPWLCLFGDNSYVNTFYMALPFKSKKGGVKDDYNFYNSQVRIKVECCFGMFFNHWGILWRALPHSGSQWASGS